MDIVLIVIVALLPVVFLFNYINKKDSGRPEPVGMLVKAFFYGVLSIAVALALSHLLSALGFYVDEPETVYDAVRLSFFGAAVPEEIAKFIMLWLLLRKSLHFDERLDGIVYATCVSLGFAAVENILYLVNNGDDWLSVGITRALFAVPGHFFDGVLMGYYFSKVEFIPSHTTKDRIMVLMAPILAHGIYDSILFSISVLPMASLFLLPAFFYFCNKLRIVAGKKILRHLAADNVNFAKSVVNDNFVLQENDGEYNRNERE